jgi:hypothetical protein
MERGASIGEPSAADPMACGRRAVEDGIVGSAGPAPGDASGATEIARRTGPGSCRRDGAQREPARRLSRITRLAAVGLLAATVLAARAPATGEEPVSWAGFAEPGCGKLGTADLHQPAPDGSDAYLQTASFDLLCEDGSTARIGIQIDKAGMMLVRRFYYLRTPAREATWAPSVATAIRGACGCR